MVGWQLTIDCREPTRLAHFWAEVLDYDPAPPPSGFDSWNEWYRAVGVPPDELDDDADAIDRLVDPRGEGPRIWFQRVPEGKVGKNRLHLDVYVGGGRDVPLPERRRRVDDRVAQLVALGATVQQIASSDVDAGRDHYFTILRDPEGNEFCVA